MGAENKVQIVISTRDESTGVVRSIQGSFNSLATDVTAVAFAFNQVQTAVNTVLAGLKPMIDTALKFQGFETSLETITESAAGAAREMEFITETADRLNLELTRTVSSYSSFIASTKNSSLEGEKARNIFLGVAEAIAAQQLPAETSERVMWQLTQMVSKGKVTLEDLNIVAEALPGTLQAVADSMGITREELLKMISSGNALADDVLPKLGDYFHDKFGKAAEEAAKKGQGAINNFKNAVTDAELELGKLILPEITDGLNAIADNFNLITSAAEVLAGAGMAVVIGRIGNAAITAAAKQAELVIAVQSGNAVMLDSAKATMLKERASLSATLALQAEKVALVEKAQAEVMAANAALSSANATRDAFAALIRKTLASDAQIAANQALAVAEAEQALAVNASSAALARYTEASAAATLGSRALAGASRMLSAAMAFVGGPIGLAVIAIAAMGMSLRNIDREVKQGAEDRKKAQADAEQSERQAVADAKAREDRLVAAAGETTEKLIHELRRRTQEKLDQLEADRAADDAAAGQDYETYSRNFDRYQKARVDLLRAAAAEERKIRDEAVKKELDDLNTLLKAAEGYYAALGDLRGQNRASLDQEYNERLKQVHAYYNAEMARAGESGADLAEIEEKKRKDLFQLQLQYSVKRALLEEETKKRALDIAESEGSERIALIKRQVAEGIRTETDAAEEIAFIRASIAEEQYAIAEKQFEQISEVYGRDSQEYIDAQKAKAQAFENLTSAQTEQIQAAENAYRAELEKSSIDYRLELNTRLDWLKDSERDCLITHQQAVRDRMEAEVTYLRQISELRARELADTTPDTVEYMRALEEKYQADREYYEAKKALDDQVNAENIARHQAELDSINEGAEAAQQSFRSFSEWFYAQWDAITERVTSLGPNMAAAFGSPLENAENTIEGLREKMEEVAEATRQAAEMSRDYFQFSRLLGDYARKAEKLRYEYYSQKLTVAELTEQLKKMSLATDEHIRRATDLVGSMDLLNESDLSDVRSEIDRLTNSLKVAEEQAQDTVDSLRDELDQMLGNTEAIENRDYEQKRADLEQKLKDAQDAGNLAIVQEYQEALTLLDEIHNRKIKSIQDEAAAARIAAEKQHEEELQRIEEEAKARKEALGSGSAFSGPAIVSRARGGKIPGFDSPVDNIWVHARTGEWYIQNESAGFWGDPFMYGVNNPESEMGRLIQERMSGVFHSVTAPIMVPKTSFSTGGPVLATERPSGVGHTFNIYTTEPVDEKLIRRKIIPELERYERRKK